MIAKPLLVGLMPNKTNGGPPLTGQIGSRLCLWAGIEPIVGDKTILFFFDTENIFNEYSDIPNVRFASIEANRIRREAGMRPVVLCGRDVASYFGMSGAAYWFWHGNYVVIPHPSGRTRLYNDQENCARTGDVLVAAIQFTIPNEQLRRLTVWQKRTSKQNQNGAHSNNVLPTQKNVSRSPTG